MGWVHRHKHRGAGLALIALALQIALTFGHVHLRGVGAGNAIIEQARLAHTPPQAPAQAPVDHDDYCAICASIFLASSGFAPAPPQLLVPADFQRVEHSVKYTRPLADSLRLAFRSRAPPTA